MGEKCDLLLVSPGVMPPVLTEGDRVLLPGLVVSHEVDCDVLPVVLVSTVHP